MEQITLHAASESALDALLKEHGLRMESGGVARPADGVGYEYLGETSVGGAAIRGVFGQVWIDPAKWGDERIADLKDTLYDVLYTGEPLNRLAGTSGYREPTGAAFVERHSRRLAGNRPLRAAQNRWPADTMSRQRYLALAAIATIPDDAKLPTVDGNLIPVTRQLVNQLVRAMVRSDQSLIAVTHATTNALRANPELDVAAVEWPEVAD